MNWRTEIEQINLSFKIDHKSKLLSLGSCFSDVMGKRFFESKFSVAVNPFGILFNPLSIAHLFESNKLPPEHIIEVNNMFYHLDIHSSIRSNTREELIKELDELKTAFDQQLETVDSIFITLGTAFVYDYNETKKTVANCHKLPLKNFTKRLLTVGEIVTSLSKLMNDYPEKQFVFTVSPVRHTKEGMSENMLSKSILRVACGELVKLQNCNYFPSYEIMLDDLRDYRYYKEDLIHVNAQGENYIWEQVATAFFDTQTNALLEKIHKVRRNIGHRPFNPNTKSHLIFLEKSLKEVELLNKELDFEEEIIQVKKQIADVNY